MDPLALALLLAAVALVYATIGQAGGTAFLAVFALGGLPTEELRPTALALNIAAAGYATWRLGRDGAIDWRYAARLCLPSLPAAFLGGLIVLQDRWYLGLTGAVLLAAAAMTVLRAPEATRRPTTPAPAVLAGAALGLLAGLTGIGGGIFLAPLLIALGWATARQASTLSPPFILANSVFGLVGVMMAGQHPPVALGLYLPAVVAGAAVGTLIGRRFLSEAATRGLLALILVAAGMRLILA